MFKKTIEVLISVFTPERLSVQEHKPYRPNRFINLSRNFEYDVLSQPEEVEQAIEERFRSKVHPHKS